ncbi:MAG TPA: methylated-DNA--[protein]-cysteine S-methyltransferase, partial [Gammaproteobacteria bacterium]|nr:methylated-DNA--[protein]-cysteine S-methyltransferase [Gammaproteobacteria bacterium]
MIFDSPIGRLTICFEASAVCKLNFGYQADAEQSIETSLMAEFSAQLQGYFSSSVRPFSFPVLLRGTAFQQRVWHALQQISVGEVRTYGQLAEQLHSSARAVGNACRQNPVPLLVPCH